jgi:hypothetical protein
MARKAERIAHKARLAAEKWREYFKRNIDQYHEMHTFVCGEQWTKIEQDEMLKTFKKVPLTANQLAALANTLLGEQQQNTPQLQVVPMTNCVMQTAQLRELVVKDIMFSTSAMTVYQIAAAQAFIGGFGVFCVDTEFKNQKSFDQDIIYRSLKDSTRSYFDMGAEDVNKTDGMHAGYISRMTRAKFRDTYGKDLEEKISSIMKVTASQEEIALATQPNEGEDPFNWADSNGITIIDHYERKSENDTLFKLSNGKDVNKAELQELIDKSRNRLPPRPMNQVMNQEIPAEMQEDMMQQGENPIGGNQEILGAEIEASEPKEMSSKNNENNEIDELMTIYDEGEPVRIVESKEYKRYKIMHYRIAGDYILDSSEFPSEHLPVIFVDQNSFYDKNGKQVCRSFFGDAKDTQRYINYLRTQSAYILKISRYDQYMGSKKNAQGIDTQRKWADPSSTQGLITYDESPTGAKPEQLRPPELSQSLLTQYQLAVEDLYRLTGLYPAKLGQQGNEVSGVAIDARTRQGSYSTYVAFNSINRAIGAAGVVVNEMIPHVYDSERVIALMTPDEGMKNIIVNQQMDDYGERIENDIRKGTFDVRLKPGPSYEGQKQEALISLKQILEADPQSFKLIADLYAENLPLVNTIEIKNRLKTMVPPEIIEAGKTGKMPQENGQPTPEQQMMQMQAQAAQQQMQMQQQQMQIKQQELELKKQQILIDAQYKLQELETERMQAAAEIQEQELRYAAESERTAADTQIAHADNLVRILTHNPAHMNQNKR